MAGSTGGGTNCLDPVTNNGNNIDDGASCGWGSNYGSKSSTDPLLGELGYYGGPTFVHPLKPGSPAIDGITFLAPNNCPNIDQRGYPRPADGDLGRL